MIFAAESDVQFYASPGYLAGTFIVGALILAFNIYCVIDANKYESWVWERSGQNKSLWVGLLIGLGIVGFCCCGIAGLVAPIIYLVSTKKKLDAAQSGGGSGYGTGYAPPGPYPQG